MVQRLEPCALNEPTKKAEAKFQVEAHLEECGLKTKGEQQKAVNALLKLIPNVDSSMYGSRTTGEGLAAVIVPAATPAVPDSKLKLPADYQAEASAAAVKAGSTASAL
jgi:hypothetical protein